MQLTNKITYLVTEYQLNVKPTIEEIVAYVGVLNSLVSEDLMGNNFSNLSAADQASTSTEIEGLRSNTLTSIKSKLLPLAEALSAKANNLLVTRKDHVVDMSENVETDGGISGTSAQVQSLKTTATGMSAITPNGGSGAALVAGENAPTIINLATQTDAKATQMQQATTLVPTLASSASELTDFEKILPQLKI